MSRGEADLVASIRHELAAIRPARTCCIQAQLAALTDSGRRVDVALARAVHELSTELAQRGAARGWEGSPRSQAERCVADLAHARSAQHCRLALLRGRILARGSLSLASGSVHLEINVSSDEATDLARLTERDQLGGHRRERRGKGLLVWKGRDLLIDLLRRLGATAAVAEMEARGVGREMRGSLNRSVNAETANLSRAVHAGIRQARACATALEEDLVQADGVHARVARYRSAAPEATLSELAAELDLARSTVQRALAEIERRVRTVQAGDDSARQPLR
ncbi:MAG: DNA-binding protein WhiA [Candidatus Aquidulcis sp.]|nr:MAG: DNA-binding protein WhiA [Candidatus Aquidulcis sp.]